MQNSTQQMSDFIIGFVYQLSDFFGLIELKCPFSDSKYFQKSDGALLLVRQSDNGFLLVDIMFC